MVNETPHPVHPVRADELPPSGGTAITAGVLARITGLLGLIPSVGAITRSALGRRLVIVGSSTTTAAGAVGIVFSGSPGPPALPETPRA